MISLQDQTGFEVSLPAPARRIVSLVPSQTELLYDLGLDEQVVGITRFCAHPPGWQRVKARIGGTKDVRIEKLAALKPDLILANKEENVREQVEAMRMLCPVWTSDVSDLASAQRMIQAVGLLCGRETASEMINREISAGFRQLQTETVKPTCLYLVWKDPLMTVGGDTFIHDMLAHAGFENVTGHLFRYPVLTEPEVAALDPDILLLSSEPYPFREKHLAEFRTRFPGTRIQWVDGTFFSWYGSRLRHAPAYFSRLKAGI